MSPTIAIDPISTPYKISVRAATADLSASDIGTSTGSSNRTGLVRDPRPPR